ncbi:MAG TPA: hypothetical protein DCQ32_00240 [Cyanobacteria bacterium UBA8156]|jgi:hypothetical protein|nr:hypothetical protein [Cyanobacteria bacterium UBA8156]
METPPLVSAESSLWQLERRDRTLVLRYGGAHLTEAAVQRAIQQMETYGRAAGVVGATGPLPLELDLTGVTVLHGDGVRALWERLPAVVEGLGCDVCLRVANRAAAMALEIAHLDRYAAIVGHT